VNGGYEHHTEVDGREATWRLTNQRIEIMRVRNTSHDPDSDVEFAPDTDLAKARGRRLAWNRWWNMIRRVTSYDQDADVEFAPGTDLAEARERRPAWNQLWDMIRREFWDEYTRSSRRSPGSCTARWIG